MKLFFTLTAAFLIFLLFYHPINAMDVKLIGSYSNVQAGESGEHCYGYDVNLYEYNGSLLGDVNFSAGLCGDPPMGVLDKVKVDRKTGRLSFESKLSVSPGYPGGPGYPGEDASKDILTFVGQFDSNEMSGAITWGLSGETKDRQNEAVTLKKVDMSWRRQSLSYDEWKKQTQDILNFRGPKW